MSAILDALKKSENDRKKGNSPDFASAQMLMTGRKKKLPFWGWLIVLLLLINLVVVIAFYISNQENGKKHSVSIGANEDTASLPPPLQKSEQPDSMTQVTGAKREHEDESALAQRAAKIAYSQSSGADREVVKHSDDADESNDHSETTYNTPEITEQASVDDVKELTRPSAEEVPYLTDMERAFQQQIPNLVFNSHIYASSPERRRIMINNEYLSQGQRIEGLIIEEITPDGVILSKDGTPFKLSVVRNWSFQ